MLDCYLLLKVSSAKPIRHACHNMHVLLVGHAIANINPELFYRQEQIFYLRKEYQHVMVKCVFDN